MSRLVALQLVRVYPYLLKGGALLELPAPGTDWPLRLRVTKELGTHTICVVDGGSHPRYRLPNGKRKRVLPVLEDMGTAGVILGCLGDALQVVNREPNTGEWRVYAQVDGLLCCYAGTCLGDAAARALTALKLVEKDAKEGGSP